MSSKLQQLRERISNFSSLLVAFSGGADSTLLLKICSEVLGEKCTAATVDAEIISNREIDIARERAKELGVRHIVVPAEVTNIPEISDNSPKRCYYCKKFLFSLLFDTAKKLDCDGVVDGTNIDDCSEYRPGIKALSEMGVVSPFKELHFSKHDIQKFSISYELPTLEVSPNSCLATRFPYGERITIEKLNQVEAAEEFLFNEGFKQLRVRYHGPTARIEVPKSDLRRFFDDRLRKRVVAVMESLGFSYVTVDLKGFRSGSMDEALENGEDKIENGN